MHLFTGIKLALFLTIMSMFPRAFEGFDMLLTESFNEQASDETLRRKIIVALPILDK